MSHLLKEDAGSVRILTLNRPEQLNAMDSALYVSLIDALREADADPAVNIILIAGAGKSFCAGADTKEFEHLTPDQVDKVEYRAGLTYELHKTLPELSKVVVAAVQGFAVGGGAGLALACDVTIASADAKLGYQEIRHGLVAAVVMANLTKQVGRKAAFDLVSSGRLLSAEEAARIGMVTRVVPAGEALATAKAVAAELATRPAEALRATKQLFLSVADVPLAEGLLLGRKANEAMRGYRALAVERYGRAVQLAKNKPAAADN